MTAPARPRSRRWPWFVAALVVAALAVGAWFAGDAIARGIVERAIRDRVQTQLALPADQQIDVAVAGAVLPQLIVGSLGDVTISSRDVSLEGVTADVSVRAQDINIHGGDWSGGYATVTLDAAQAQTLLATVPDFPASTVTIQAPSVTATFDLNVFSVSVPVGVSLTPSADGGDLVLTPTSLRVGDAEVTADALRQQFGVASATVLRDWRFCIADRLPGALRLTGVETKDDRIVADFEIDSSIVHDSAAQQRGTCS